MSSSSSVAKKIARNYADQASMIMLLKEEQAKINGHVALVLVRAAFEANRDGTTHADADCTIACFIDVRKSLRTLVRTVRTAAWFAHAQPCGVPHEQRFFETCRVRSPTHAWPLYAARSRAPLLPSYTPYEKSLLFIPLDGALASDHMPPLNSYDDAYGEPDVTIVPIDGKEDRFERPITACSELALDKCADNDATGIQAIVDTYAQCAHMTRMCAGRSRVALEQRSKCCNGCSDAVRQFHALTGNSILSDTLTTGAAAATTPCTPVTSSVNTHAADCMCVMASFIRRTCRYTLQLEFVPPPVDYTYYVLGDDVLATRSAIVHRYLNLVGNDAHHGAKLVYKHAACEERRGNVKRVETRALFRRPRAFAQHHYNQLLDAARRAYRRHDVNTLSALVVADARADFDTYVGVTLRESLAWLPPLARVYILHALAHPQRTVVQLCQTAAANDGDVIEPVVERDVFSEFAWCDNRRLVVARAVAASLCAPRTLDEHFSNAVYTTALVCALAIAEHAAGRKDVLPPAAITWPIASSSTPALIVPVVSSSTTASEITSAIAQLPVPPAPAAAAAATPRKKKRTSAATARGRAKEVAKPVAHASSSSTPSLVRYGRSPVHRRYRDTSSPPLPPAPPPPQDQSVVPEQKSSSLKARNVTVGLATTPPTPVGFARDAVDLLCRRLMLLASRDDEVDKRRTLGTLTEYVTWTRLCFLRTGTSE